MIISFTQLLRRRGSLMLYVLPLVLIFFVFTPASAKGPSRFEQIDSRYEKRFRNLAGEFRCLVCQNQSILESNADLAKDLKHQIYTMMQQGRTDQEIINYLVARYGDFVLYRPPLRLNTFLLWTGPFLLLIIAVIGVTVFVRKRRAVTDSDFSAAESKRIKSLLKENGRDGVKE